MTDNVEMTVRRAQTRHWLWRQIGDQLSHPRGVAGALAGWLMSILNRKPNQLAIEALNLAPTDQILEIGFGPGRSLHSIADLHPGCDIYGIDQSATMMMQAQRKNHQAISEGRMRLVRGQFDTLPWLAQTFDKILLVNVIYFFDPAGRALAEMYRVLRSGGRVVIYATDRKTMNKWPFARSNTHRTFNSLELRGLLLGIGFKDAQINVQTIDLPMGITGLIAIAQKT